jgi:hypothetical protein
MGLEAVDRAISLTPHGVFREDDPDLMIHTADELRVELRAGMRRDSTDMNPLGILRKRK